MSAQQTRYDSETAVKKKKKEENLLLVVDRVALHQDLAKGELLQLHANYDTFTASQNINVILGRGGNGKSWHIFIYFKTENGCISNSVQM